VRVSKPTSSRKGAGLCASCCADWLHARRRRCEPLKLPEQVHGCDGAEAGWSAKGRRVPDAHRLASRIIASHRIASRRVMAAPSHQHNFGITRMRSCLRPSRAPHEDALALHAPPTYCRAGRGAACGGYVHRRLPTVARLRLVARAGDADEETSLCGLAGGCCIDFNKQSDHLFVVGTEEGASAVEAFSRSFLPRAALARSCLPVVAGCFSHEHEATTREHSCGLRCPRAALRCAGGAFSLPAYSDSGRAFTRR
jgi:hypothetical protein